MVGQEELLDEFLSSIFRLIFMEAHIKVFLIFSFFVLSPQKRNVWIVHF